MDKLLLCSQSAKPHKPKETLLKHDSKAWTSPRRTFKPKAKEKAFWEWEKAFREVVRPALWTAGKPEEARAMEVHCIEEKDKSIKHFWKKVNSSMEIL